MLEQKLKSPAILGKFTIVGLGIVILGAGLHSHFQSNWREVNKECDAYNLKGLSINCPSGSMEVYFVSMSIICFILSITNLTFFLLDLEDSRITKLRDIGYHFLSAILLLIAAILYIVSAKRIYNLKEEGEISPVLILKFREKEKTAAGVLGIVQALLYGVVGICIIRS